MLAGLAPFSRIDGPTAAMDTEITSGYLIVKTFEQMCREYPFVKRADYVPFYSMPKAAAGPDAVAKRYRGISRDPLEAWASEDLELGFPGIPPPGEPTACLAMDQLEGAGQSQDDFIFDADDARRVFKLLVQPSHWELIWACTVEYEGSRPEGTSLLGFEPTWWRGDHFSAIMDSMCFPRWHGPDPQGSLLTRFHDLLNPNALFATADDALQFLRFYESQTWAETGDYVIAEVRHVSDVG